MKKVLILTVIAILALGVMALADYDQSSDSNGDLVFNQADVTITVDGWIQGTLTPEAVEITNFTSVGAWYKTYTLDVQSNAKFEIAAQISDLPSGIEAIAAKVNDGTTNYESDTAETSGDYSGYFVMRKSDTNPYGFTAGTASFDGYFKYTVDDTTGYDQSGDAKAHLNVIIIAEVNNF
jgi:hypothetical protein